MPEHPIFHDIDNGDLEAVKARVLADAAVLEIQEETYGGTTPVTYALEHKKDHHRTLADRAPRPV